MSLIISPVHIRPNRSWILPSYGTTAMSNLPMKNLKPNGPDSDSDKATAEEKSPDNPGTSSQNDGVVEPLTSGQVRWFYRELAVNSEWTPFGGYDTLLVEAAYNKLPPDLKGPRPLELIKEEDSVKEEPKVEAEYSVAAPKVTVLSGLYELDLSTRKVSSIYWPGEIFQCTRGTWFYKSWQPVDEITADLIEQEHLKAFRGQKISNFTSGPKPIHHQSFTDYNVDWYTPNEVYLYSNVPSSQFVKSFTRTIGYFQKSAGTRVIRAYKTLATDMDSPKDITHMVFIVHGVGQCMNMNVGDRVFGNTCAIRSRVAALKEDFFPGSNQYAGFFPVEWRTKVSLCDSMIACLTPVHIKYVRDFLNTSAMDVMYYMSPIYCGQIQECVANEMNRLYTAFCERNTHIKPKVSVIAHSLGATIVYDIVTGYQPQGNTSTAEPGRSGLQFDLDKLFFFGSPLSVFLALRAERGTSGRHLFPQSVCNRVYNVYYVTDPIAYRLEPLVVEDYCKIAPLQIQPYNIEKPVRYSEMPLVQEGDETTSPNAGWASAPFDHSTVTASSAVPDMTDAAEMPLDDDRGRIFSNDVAGRVTASSGFAEVGAEAQATARPSTSFPIPSNTSRISSPFKWKSQKNNAPAEPPVLTETLEHRLDYVLTAGATGPFVFRSVLVSHMAYWGDNDVAFFVLTRLFPELEDEACSDNRPTRKNKRKRPDISP